MAGRGQQQQQQKKKRYQKGLEDNVRRTVYISYVDSMIKEESLAQFFQDCGRIVDCRICGDPNSAMRFAFIEFLDTEAVNKVGFCIVTCGSRPVCWRQSARGSKGAATGCGICRSTVRSVECESGNALLTDELATLCMC
jgi:RNA recognition motif. (a.k.a. RRM, RBD, or RNP domain)